jgi:hypothetical protein
MFYFLLSNSSITKIKDPEKKLLTAFLYGSVLYIIFHAIINASSGSFFQIIKSYYWILLALDIFTLFIYYKEVFITLIRNCSSINKVIFTIGTLIQDILTKITNISDYSNEVEFTSSTPNDIFNDVKCTLDNLKQKTHDLEEKHNTISQENKKVRFNIDSTQTPQQKLDINNSDTIIENDDINNINDINNTLQQINNDFFNNTQTNKKSNVKIESNTSSSIKDIRNKQKIDNTKLFEYDNNVLLENRDQLTNSELENIKLDYNPNDLLENIVYESEQKNELLNGNTFLSGNANEALLNNVISPSQNITQTNNEDTTSIISNISDLGSILDLNLDDFENKL